VWSLAAAGNANQSRKGEIARKFLIVLDSIIQAPPQVVGQFEGYGLQPVHN
jgi:hypothetical protein